MNDPAIKKSFENNYVITHLTILESADKKSLENPGAIELYTKYAGPKGQGIPFWIIYDKNGKFLSDAQSSPGMNTGCPATREEVQYFITVLKKTSKISNEQMVAIEKRFRKNE